MDIILNLWSIFTSHKSALARQYTVCGSRVEVMDFSVMPKALISKPVPTFEVRWVYFIIKGVLLWVVS